MVGETISHYRVLEKLGEGGMGVVYKGEDVNLKRTVALKFLHAGEDTARLLREAQAAASLMHPNICTVFEVDSEHGLLAMELIEGPSLRDKIQDRPLKLDEAIRLASEIAAGLQAAHEKGIVHRDIKAGNVLLTPSGQPKLTDFGLALLPGRSRLTKTAMTLGTPGYMSPEQARGETVDRRADIWSLGVVIYEMLAGRLPFQGDSEAAVVHSILNDEPEPLTALRAGLPLELDRIVAKCLAKDPADRYQHVEDLLVDLRRVRAVSSSHATRAAPRRRMFQAALGYVLPAVAAAAATWFLTRPATPPESSPQILTRLTSDPGLTFQPAISPGGELLAYASDRSGRGDLDVWVQRIGDRQAIRVTDHEADDSEPAFAPDGHTIAFRSGRDGGGIYLVQPFGGTARKLVSGGYRPRFSPDGRWIAYGTGDPNGIYLRSKHSEIYVVSPSGGAPRKIRADFSTANLPIWLPDGRLLFIGAREAGPPSPEIVDWWITPLDGGTPVKTGFLSASTRLGMTGVFLSDSVLQAPVPEAWLPAQQAVVFNAASGDSSGLWAAPLALAEGRLSAALRRITFGSASEAWPAVWPDGSRILFSSLQTNIDIWSLRLDASTGKARGEPERITQDLAPDHGPALSPDGSLLAFTSTRFGNQDIWIKDLATGNESLLAATPFADWFPLFSPDGTRVAFSSGENTRYPLYIVTRGAAAAEKVCEEGGLPTSWSADGNRVFIAEDIEGDAKISVVDVSNGRVTRLIGAPGKDYFGGRVSPDGGWLVFTELTGQMRHVGFVAPMNELSAPAWARTDLTGFWSPDGRFLYNLSDRDGFFCLWARPFNPSAPADGAVFPVFHSHQARRRIANIPPAIFYLSLKAGRLVFPMGERTGNIWMMELKP